MVYKAIADGRVHSFVERASVRGLLIGRGYRRTMTLTVISSGLRACIALVLMAAFAVVPLSASAETAHPCDEGVVICADIELSQSEPGEAPTHHSHDHPVHHCGSCHVHMMGEPWLPMEFAEPVQSRRVIPTGVTAPRTGSDGPYRPPRA